MEYFFCFLFVLAFLISVFGIINFYYQFKKMYPNKRKKSCRLGLHKKEKIGRHWKNVNIIIHKCKKCDEVFYEYTN